MRRSSMHVWRHICWFCLQRPDTGRAWASLLGLALLGGWFAACKSLPAPLPLAQKAPLKMPPSADFIHQERKIDADEEADDSDLEKIVSTGKNKKGRIITTVYSGAVLVREVKRRQGLEHVRITISGNATIRHENIVIRAHRMTIEDNRRGTLTGRVHIIDRESRTHIFAKRASYDRDRELVILDGNPYMLIYPKPRRGKQGPPAKKRRTLLLSANRPALVTCKRMIRLLDQKESRLLGDVRIHQEPWNLLGDEGISKDGSDMIWIRTNPMIFGQDQFLVGDKLKYYISKRQAVLDSRVVFLSRSNILLPDDSKKENAQAGEKAKKTENKNTESLITAPKMSLEEFGRMGGRIRSTNSGKMRLVPTVTVLSADRLGFMQASEDAPARTDIEGSVLLTRSDLEVRSSHLVALGEDFHTLYTNKGVEMTDRSRGMHVRAGVMDYRINEKLLRLERNPEMEFFKKGTDEVESTLRAAVIERDFESGKMLARGNVHLNRDNFEAVSEQARYKEKEGVIILEGDPGIVSEKNLIRAEKILYYTEKKRVFLYRRIRAELGMNP